MQPQALHVLLHQQKQQPRVSSIITAQNGSVMTVEDNLWADTTFRVGARRNDWVRVCSSSVAIKLSPPYSKHKVLRLLKVKGIESLHRIIWCVSCALHDCSQCYLQLILKILLQLIEIRSSIGADTSIWSQRRDDDLSEICHEYWVLHGNTTKEPIIQHTKSDKSY